MGGSVEHLRRAPGERCLAKLNPFGGRWRPFLLALVLVGAGFGGPVVARADDPPVQPALDQLLGTLLGPIPAPTIAPAPVTEVVTPAPLPESPPLVPIARLRAPILYFHEIATQRSFEAVVTGLLAAGYTPVPLSTIVDRLSGRDIPMPPRPIALTFDDGLKSQYQNAFPVLARLRLPGTFFVIPTYQDGVHRYMTEADWREMLQAGMDIESHSLSHSSLGAANVRRTIPVLNDIRDSRVYLEDVLRQVDPGYRVRFFAYPNGSYNATVAGFVGQSGYDAGFSTNRKATHTPGEQLYYGRIRADGLSAASIIDAINRAP